MYNTLVLCSIFFVYSFARYTDYYSLDGSGNNKIHSNWGSVGDAFIHSDPWLGWSFVDGVGKPVPTNKYHPSTRYVSNVLSQLPSYKPNPKNHLGWTEFTTYWGQFITHEMTHAPTSEEPLYIEIPKCDPVFDRKCHGDKLMSFNRTVYLHGTGRGKVPRKFPNIISAFIDGSTVYGNSKARHKLIREFRDGRLKTSAIPPYKDGDYPPRVSELKKEARGYYHDELVANELKNPNSDELFVCGEYRCNENPVLLCLQILFLREHNRVAGVLNKKYPKWSDEKIFQEARKYVVALMQKITYYEYLPSLIGRKFPKYTGYNPKVNPSVHAFFSVVAHRFGHSVVNDHVDTYELDEKKVVESFELREYFFDPEPLETRGISGILKGAALTLGGEVDGYVVEDLRSFLFGSLKPRFDLGAFNMMRAWDQGLPFYNDCRVAYGLEPVKEFKDFPTYYPSAKDKLSHVYLAPKFVDPWIGGLLEAHEPGSSLGPLFERAILDQFWRTRAGDRFYFENIADQICKDLEPVLERSLGDIIRDNTLARYIPDDVFNYYRKNYN